MNFRGHGYGVGMATTLPRISFPCPPDLLGRIEEWRKQQSPIPNQSEAIRRLLQLGLDAPKSSSQEGAPEGQRGA